jgi:TonB-linked SusC/RagA family outer membrane protein
MRMRHKYAALILSFLILLPFGGKAQGTGAVMIIQGNVTSSLDGEPLTGAVINEIDVNNRVVSATTADINGHYVLKIKNPKNNLSVAFMGFEKQVRKIEGKTVINFILKDASFSLGQVVVKGSKETSQGGYSIPNREIGTAMQTINAKEFEGLQVSSVDEALQGRIAGLDIVSNSGDPGSGSSMRIRGVTSINGSSEPLVVVNGVPYEVQIDPNFDFANSNQEQYANMLSINPDDILEISVLKDAAASAIWGSKGANGVLMITTKKGATGAMKVEYTYRKTRTVQPKGMEMLSGGDFTMLMKQAYLNPKQNEEATLVDEYMYNKNFTEYENFNNNTDWVKEITQVGNIDDHYLTISGGGERASYRVTGGFFNQKGTIIGQSLGRISSRAYLEYTVSDRIKFITEFSLTNSDNYRSYTDDNNKLSLLAIAYQKMPNVSVYAQDSKGNNTDAFYNISRSSMLDDDQKYLKNPVALATLATNNLKSFRILPTFRMQYDILDPAKTFLQYKMYVSFDINNSKTTKFLPQEVSNLYWADEQVNRAENSDSEGLTIYSEQSLAWQPKFENPDHSFLLYGAFQIYSGNSAGQGMVTYSLPSGKAIDASNFGYLEDANTGHSTWRSLAVMARTHYSYKSRYIFDATFRRDGSTKFGAGNKFGNFPGVSLKWIASDEPFLKGTKSWLSTLAFRPAWGISGNQPGEEYLHYSRYELYGSYLGVASVKPVSLRLSDLKWETTESFNYGLDLGFLDDSWLFDLNFYKKQTTDLLFKDVSIPSLSGYSKLSYINGGTMNNDGWEVNLYANRIVKAGKFSIDFRFNLSNYMNVLVDLKQSLLDSYNKDFDYSRGSYLTRVQEGNSFGSIYGFRYKGVYQYDEYAEGSQESAPVARDENGAVIVDQKGNPKSIYFAYGTESQYRFRGGDAIYEDINHDASIDELDIVYLGNSNPKVNGGFGPSFRYGNLNCTLFFNFRYGNKIINAARMNAENMYYDNNQSVAVNWRWRKDGDVTDMPRALHEYGYNWLGSDRYVEDGSFLRLKYVNFNYSVEPSKLKRFGMNKMSLYLTFNNLFVLTKYTGVDPEVGYGSLGLSTDNSSTPRTKDVTLGLSIGF